MHRIENKVGTSMSISKKKLKKILLTKLNSLYGDVNSSPDRTADYLDEIKRTQEDKRKLLMNVYAGDHAPLKVSDYSGLPKRECDMTGEMLDFSSGFENYLNSIEEEYDVFIRQKRDAVALLCLILSLRLPYSRILYMRYYKRMSPDDACAQMHIARATLFRKRSAALGELAELFAARNDIELIKDC